MGTFKFSIKMLKREYKKAMVYAFTLMFTISVCFIFFEIISNPYLKGVGAVSGGGSWNEVTVPVVTGLAFIIIIFCCAMIIFANNFYLLNKTDELAIMSMSGLNFISLTKYILYQTVMIIIFVMPMGLLIGYLITLLIHHIMYTNLSINYSIYKVSLSAFSNTFWSILSMIFSVLTYSSGYVYRNDIATMLSVQTVNELEDKRLFKFPKWLYLLIYVLCILLMIFCEYSTSVFLLPSFLGTIFLGGVLKYVVPDFLNKLKKDKYIDNKIKLISISNLSYSLKKSIILVSLYIISITVLSTLLISNQNDIKSFITIIIAYIVMVILILLGIFYKYMAEVMDRKILFYNLYKLGYVKKQLNKIILDEVLTYFSILSLMPLVFIIIMNIRCYIHNDVSIMFIILLILGCLIPTIIVSLITYYNYKKLIFNTIEGGVHYE